MKMPHSNNQHISAHTDGGRATVINQLYKIFPAYAVLTWDVSPLRPDDVPKPVLPLGVICYNCNDSLTQQERNSFSVGVSVGLHSGNNSTNRKWSRYHADCTHKQSSSVSIYNFDIMLSKLSDSDRGCVISSVAKFAAAKNAIKMRLAAEAATMAHDGPLVS